MVALAMYKELQTDEEKGRLRIHWYTGKDQRTPLTATKKSRNCHVKLAIFDGEVGMQGNGNQGEFIPLFSFRRVDEDEGSPLFLPPSSSPTHLLPQTPNPGSTLKRSMSSSIRPSSAQSGTTRSYRIRTPSSTGNSISTEFGEIPRMDLHLRELATSRRDPSRVWLE